MKILKLDITAFGGLKEKTIDLKDGINVFCGENESGKSTICAFIEAMLYGMNKPTKNDNHADLRSKYLPWDTQIASGSLEFEFSSKKYVIERKFGKTKRSDKATLRLSDTWEECTDFDFETVGLEILGLSEESFVKSVFMGQLQTGISGKDDEIVKKLSNLSESGDEEASFSDIENILQTAKYSIIPKASAKSIMGDLKAKKEALLLEEKEIELLNENLKDSVSELNVISKKTAELSSKIKQLRVEKEKAREYEKFISDAKIKENIEKLILRRKESIKTAQNIENEIKSLEEKVEKIDKTALSDALFNINSFKNVAEEEKINQVKLANEREKAENFANALKTEKNKANKTSFAIMVSFAIAFLILSLTLTFLLKSFMHQNTSFMLSVMFGAVSCILFVFSFLALNASKKHAKNALEIEDKLQNVEDNINKILASSKKDENIKNIEDIFKKFNVHSEEELKKQYDFFVNLENKLEILNGELSFAKKNIAQLECDIKSCENMLAGSEECEKTRPFDEVDSELSHKNSELNELEKRKKELEFNIENKGNGFRTLDIVRSELTAIEPEIEYYNSVHSSLEIALNVLKECEEELKSGFSPELNKSVNKILSVLTGGKYSEIKLSDDYSVHVKTPEISEIKNAEFLSGGTYDLIYFAVRLAILKNVFPDKIPLLILDDTFLQLDDERQKKAIEYLSYAEEIGQVCYFTCHKDVLNKFTDTGKVSVTNL